MRKVPTIGLYEPGKTCYNRNVFENLTHKMVLDYDTVQQQIYSIFNFSPRKKPQTYYWTFLHNVTVKLVS